MINKHPWLILYGLFALAMAFLATPTIPFLVIFPLIVWIIRRLAIGMWKGYHQGGK